MGDRALVTFKKKLDKSRNEVSPVVYLHWGGGDVPELLREWWKLMDGRRSDVPYATARFVGICHVDQPGNMSLGVWQSTAPLSERRTEAFSHGDSGSWIVDVETGEVECHGGYGKGFKLPSGSAATT